MKESYLVQVAEYAVAKCIANKPDFSWWVPYTIKKRNAIIAAIMVCRYQVPLNMLSALILSMVINYGKNS